MQKKGTKENVKIQWILGALIVCGFVVVAPAKVSQKNISHSAAVVDDESELWHVDDDDGIRIEHIAEISSPKESATDDKNRVITTYQQTQTLNHHFDGTNHHPPHNEDTRLLQVASKGFFDKSQSVYLFATQHKDQCQKNAYFPAWKIDKGTSRSSSNDEVFQLKINYYEEFGGKNMYLCVYFGDEKQARAKHLGENSQFNLSR
jgi:hypothetical protein